jgi:dihydrofolate reductase
LIISLIAAMDKNRGIGKNNKLPWHLPSDLKRFKRLTMGHYLMMGRKTYETIGKPLPGRVMIIVTRQKGYLAEGCTVVNSIQQAITEAENHHEEELFVIGGAEIFQQVLDIADKIYLTNVHAEIDASVYFPEIDPGAWELITKHDPEQLENDQYASDFQVLIRKH